VPPEEVVKRAIPLAKALHFTKRMNTEFSALSGGEKQAFVIMRALIHQPKLVFLDEPSKSLDPMTSKLMQQVIRNYVRRYGTTVILTTHNMREAEELCDRFAYISHGKIKFLGTPDQFKKQLVVDNIIIVHSKLENRVIDKILHLPNVKSVENNTYTKVISSDSTYTLPALVKLLESEKIRVKITTKEPSVEDVFIAMTSKQ